MENEQNVRVVRLENSVDNFYNKYISTKFTDGESELEFALEAAWKPAISSINRRKNYADPKTILSRYKDTLKKALQADIENADKNWQDKNSFNTWFIDFCENHSNVLKKQMENKNIEDKISGGSYFGIIQKYVNIAFKYLYCFWIKNKSIENGISFENCHCPIDRIITEIVKRKVLPFIKENNENVITINEIIGTGMSWSFINVETYEKFQKIITEFREKEDVNITSNLFFDFLYW